MNPNKKAFVCVQHTPYLHANTLLMGGFTRGGFTIREWFCENIPFIRGWFHFYSVVSSRVLSHLGMTERLGSSFTKPLSGYVH